ncbi:uncharacterized protein LOC18431487 [Amborella trichopoda]|uniref:COP1-interacting protein 7 n=1 Tax=Amborella trichopoda TaxID=13333 RepID=W1P8N6_AMBTC|nr:uncharacterized protein LOC18431487 [Amborella trichopoda]ERN03350.1 hypothetical protein AMTR_s00003p00244690 [Amborella trichopoda]|eukprot:XP_006841675.1 uncharacterized protein LOC18431487 [Amborella trichopoda]
MDPSTLLDYVVFQLTPTRTRCDLVVFSGGKGEKLASGLFQPFVTHLEAAREQISKGGYSIRLQVPSGSERVATWFTKGTLERFVRFVSTPEVLERVWTIEKEIVQIEDSIEAQSKMLSSVDGSLSKALGAGQTVEDHEVTVDSASEKAIVPFNKATSEANGSEPKQGESKQRLLQVLETRKAVLHREQAMAYAQALAAGFEMDNIDDLISFSNIFGASRMKEACMNFIELVKKKHDSGVSMEELVAMAASVQSQMPYMGNSGVVLTSDSLISQNGLPRINGNESEASDSVEAVRVADSVGNISSNQDSRPPINGQFQSGGDNIHVQFQTPAGPPQYMYNFQGPVLPAPPYQGYMIPGYYPGFSGNVPWSPYKEDPHHGIGPEFDSWAKHKKRSSIKTKSMSKEGPETSESTSGPQDGGSDQDDSSPESGSDAYSEHKTSLDRESASRGESQMKKPGKKTSKMVVIRNINYITSRRGGGEKEDNSDEDSSEEDVIDGDDLKQHVEDAFNSLEKHHKSSQKVHKKGSGKKHSSDGFDGSMSIMNGSDGTTHAVENQSGDWHAFQNLLLQDRESHSNTCEPDFSKNTHEVNERQVDIQGLQAELSSRQSGSQDGVGKRGIMEPNDFILTGRSEEFKANGHMDNFEFEKNRTTSMSIKRMADGEMLFLPQRMNSSGVVQDGLMDLNKESPISKNKRSEDSFVITHSERYMDGGEITDFSVLEDRGHYIAKKERELVDDSFVVPTRDTADMRNNNSEWKTEISFDVDGPSPAQQKTGAPNVAGDNKPVISPSPEPDLYIMRHRDSGVESVDSSWTPALYFGMDTLVNGAEKQSSPQKDGNIKDTVSPNGSGVGDKKQGQAKNGTKTKVVSGTLPKTKSEIISRKGINPSRSIPQKSKREKEEEERRRVEELRIQRQKRIAERSAAASPNKSTTPSKQDNATNKTPKRLPSNAHKNDSRTPRSKT